ncbi:MAG: peptidylprolyl isomerase [Ilumatobacteraceae bacterium]
MPRRLIALVLSATVLASCSTTQNAATVNGVAVLAADLEQTVKDFDTVGEAPILDGAADGETVRGLLTSLIRAEATTQLLADTGESVTEADRDEVRAELSQQNTEGFPQTLLDLIVELNSAVAALARVQAPEASVIAERYANSPKSLGMLCVRHLVVDEESTARKALGELGKSPTDEQFATVAGKYSIEPNAKQTGGALTGQSGECIALNEYQAGFDPDFVRGAFAAGAGVPTEPVKSSFGWHVIYVRPFTAVSESLSATLNGAPGEYLLLGTLASADISVASRYGKWNPLSGQVVAP